MTPKGWKPPGGLAQIPGRVNIYIIQSPADLNKNNEDNGIGHRKIT